ncbi:hypothetical protein ACFCZ3_11850 [Cellulosimicrobium cellulans]|uniref:hypothetical protein n=1 Tax=Cellulosimicrobium cellulans TaxID=1710 RepID=UPI0028A8133B|nr:hypothetical protein [Cellulosimicrobium cellulans]
MLAHVDRQGALERRRDLPFRYSTPPSSVGWDRARRLLMAAGLIVAQAAISVAVMFVAGLAVAVGAGPYEDMLSVVGWLFWSALAALLTTMCVLLVGLPVRLIPRLRTWWMENGEFTLLGAGVGAALVVVAFLVGHPDTVSDGDLELRVFQPNGWLQLVGWLLLSFSCAHVRWPRRWTRWIQRRFGAGVRAAGSSAATR